MRLLVLSDSHGKIEKALAVAKEAGAIDLIVHLGDCSKDAKAISRELKKEVLSVPGNCDGHFGKNGYKILATDFGRIFMTHGHMEGVKNGLKALIYKAESLDCRAAFFGHTHLPYYQERNGFYLLNPGSISYPGPDGQVSYAIAELNKDAFAASILFIKGKGQ